MNYAIALALLLLLGLLTLVSYTERLYAEIGKLTTQVAWLKKKLQL